MILFEICQLICATVSGVHMSLLYILFVLENRVSQNVTCFVPIIVNGFYYLQLHASNMIFVYLY
jgi:hypothetical protein